MPRCLYSNEASIRDIARLGALPLTSGLRGHRLLCPVSFLYRLTGRICKGHSRPSDVLLHSSPIQQGRTVNTVIQFCSQSA